MISNRLIQLYFISFVVFLWPLLQEYRELYLADVIYAICIFHIVVFVEVLALFLYKKISFLVITPNPGSAVFKLNSHAINLFISIISGLNFYYFCLTLINIQIETKIVSFIIFTAIIFYSIYNESRVRFIMIFCTVFLLLTLLQFSYSFTSDNSPGKVLQRWDLKTFKTLEALKSKSDRRNIYLISFDSAVSPQVLRTLYGNPEAVHLQFLEDSGFRVLDSAFSAGDNTRESFFNMMRLGEEARPIRAFYSTRSLNPSYTLFENVGYKIQFLYKHNYLGSNTNTLDYFYPEGRFITLCDYIDESYGFIACDRRHLIPLNELVFGTNMGMKAFYIKLLERIKVINNNSDEKWVTITHIYSPGHTSNNFIYTDILEKEKYIEKMLTKFTEVEQMMNEIVTLIREVDHDPVIIFYADHGPSLTRGLTYGEQNPMYTADEIYMDKLGIMFAVYPSDFCATKFLEGYNTVNLISDMLECENSK